MKIAIAQVNPVIGDFQYNFEKIVEYADKAKTRSCDLVVFTELAVSGYPPRDLLELKDFIETNRYYTQKLLKTIQGIGVIVGCVEKNPAEEGLPLFNAAVFFENGQVIQKVYKRLLPTYDVFDETRYFEPSVDIDPCSFRGRSIGITICEDTWNDKDVFQKRIYHSDPVFQLVNKGAEMIVNISASPFHADKNAFREYMLGSIAKKYNTPLIFANQVGGNDSILFDGTSHVFDRNGKVVATAKDFEEDIIVYDDQNQIGDIRTISDSLPESVMKALVMGLHDYLHKCGFSKALIGLSGGIDSALTAVVAVRALGPENVLTVFMPSLYTSKDNYTDTEQLAKNLGVEYQVIPIDGIFKEFTRYLSPSFKEDDPGVTEQNIQARIRGTLLMGISNRDGRLLLSTGNKSEMAVGYCTLYGDMNGGLGVISDVPKTIVYTIADYINSEKEIIPQRIIDKVPSAELKPDQTDQDDLPPYEVLDPILRWYIEELKSVNELVQMGYDRQIVEDIIKKVVKNEYKRQQAPPGLRVTSRAFGYGRRYPIAQRYAPDTMPFT